MGFNSDDPRLAAAVTRARSEFLEMPGLTLTVEQAARLWHLDRELSAAVLVALKDARFLVQTAREGFARA